MTSGRLSIVRDFWFVHFKKFIHSFPQYKEEHSEKLCGFNPLQQSNERSLDFPFLQWARAFGIF
jgi:hypothetical protein